MYQATTRTIQVTVESFYLDEQSTPSDDHYVWAYQIHIENQGPEVVQLLNRHWHITDANGRGQEVEGPGVVGEQPVLNPGESFEYTSGTPLTTPSGIMVGTYEMVTSTGELFDVKIPAFSLDSPYQPVSVH
jgi:ApaG protein